MTTTDATLAVTLTVAQLRQLIREAVAAAQLESIRQCAEGIERVSAGRAARIAKKGRSVVLAACASGALPAHRDGNRWSIRMSDLDAWCAAGFPEARP